jgi:hypothetical protein
MGSRLLRIGCLCLSVVLTVHAQEPDSRQLPDAPVPASTATTTLTSAHPNPQAVPVFHKKIFWTLVGVDAAALVSDAQISRTGLEMCPNYAEINSWLYGRRPSLGRYYAMDLATDGGAAFLSYKLLHSRRKYPRLLGWLPLVATSGTHADGAIRWAKVIGNNCNPAR